MDRWMEERSVEKDLVHSALVPGAECKCKVCLAIPKNPQSPVPIHHPGKSSRVSLRWC